MAKVQQTSISGTFWFAGWLFTIGFVHLTFWKGVAAIIIWPYFFGIMVSGLVH